MWTTLTHIISCSITLAFVLLFKSVNPLIHDLVKIRRLVEFSLQLIQQEESSSSMARRGVRILKTLLEFESRAGCSVDLEADIAGMVEQLAANEHCMVSEFSMFQDMITCGDLWANGMENNLDEVLYME